MLTQYTVNPTTGIGSYLYTTDTFYNTVQALAISASNGRVSAASTLTPAAGCTPEAVAAAPDGRSVHVACDGGALLGHAVEHSSGGALDVCGFALSGGGRSITFVPVP